MTNVKLKLMFYVLNSLLTADIVIARPYSNNGSNVIILANTSLIPVDSNSDTLIVSDDADESLPIKANDKNLKEEEANEGENGDVTKEVNKQQATKISKNDEEKRNISTMLDDIINSETNRDDIITDLQFKSNSEFEDEPKFEFLIAKMNDSGQSENMMNRNMNSSDMHKKVDYVELVEVVKSSKENKSAYMSNITEHEVEDDTSPDTSFTDIQTLFLACFGTLLPLLAVLCATLLIRCLCRRYCPGYCKKLNVSSRSNSIEKLDGTDQLKSPTEDSSGGGVESGGSPPANGSIFTMTLKNNHLIVETEERNDITKNGRETKMKYSPDNDGIFVVEVQQSASYRPSNKSLLNSPPHDPQISTNLALIHRVPEELEKQIEEDSEQSSEKYKKDKTLALSSTGLSISDLSMSSIGSHNVSYSYGSQLGYEQGPFGYPVYAGYEVSKDGVSDGMTYDNSQEPLITKTPTDPDKPVVTAALFKQDSIIGNDVPGYCIEGSTDGPLLSDVQAREYSLQHLQEQKKLENGVAVTMNEKIETPKKINRADSLPVRLEEETEIFAMDTIEEVDMPKEVLKAKRASLPIIRTEIYESVIDAVTSGSSMFEQLMNETIPELYDSPPMITITEESESSKSDGTS